MWPYRVSVFIVQRSMKWRSETADIFLISIHDSDKHILVNITYIHEVVLL